MAGQLYGRFYGNPIGSVLVIADRWAGAGPRAAPCFGFRQVMHSNFPG